MQELKEILKQIDEAEDGKKNKRWGPGHGRANTLLVAGVGVTFLALGVLSARKGLHVKAVEMVSDGIGVVAAVLGGVAVLVVALLVLVYRYLRA